MPPIRSLPMPKPTKTERTHEENQERAYIAASRRSDRSLEARIESARRASEIHKRRTGRSLRVTEADVINEEMYEEEDDDLPLQYRRLTAHLNGGSTDFNRRLAAYLTNHVAMRSALSNAMQSSSYGGGTHFTQPWQQPTQYQPWAPDQQHIMNYNATSNAQQGQSQATPTSTSNYRQSPYQMSNPPNFSPHMNLNRSASMSNSQSKDGKPSLLDRRASMPVNTPGLSPNAPSDGTQKSPLSTHPEHQSEDSNQNSQKGAGKSGMPTPSWSPSQQGSNLNPLTTSLPYDSQMFLGSNFNMDNFFSSPTAMNPQMPTYSYNPNTFTKNVDQLPMPGGMNQTLAPSALDGKLEKQSWPTPVSAVSDVDERTSSYGWDNPLDFGSSKHADSAVDYSTTSGQATPNDAEWAAFIDPASWDDSAAT